jgi:hypothetical protein
MIVFSLLGSTRWPGGSTDILKVGPVASTLQIDHILFLFAWSFAQRIHELQTDLSSMEKILMFPGGFPALMA